MVAYHGKSTRVVALLDSMWGDTRPGNPQQAPRAFRINPHNHSGKRLYRLCGAAANLVVTNCCRELQGHANGHGSPDPAWVAANLQWLQPGLLLVCGNVARATFKASRHRPLCKVLHLKHPAARTWTNAELENTARRIAAILRRLD